MDVFSRARKFLFDLISENVKPEFYEIFKEKRFGMNFNSKLYSTNAIENKEIGFYSDIERTNVDLNYVINFEMLPAIHTDNNTLEEKKTLSKSEEDEIRIQNDKRESDFFSCLNFDDEDKKLLSNKTNYDISKVDVYDRKEIETLMEKFDLSHLENQPYCGFDPAEKIKRILIVSHSGFISELINVIKHINNIKLHGKHHTINTGLYVMRIFCKKCGITTKCKNEISECKDNYKLEFDFVLENDVTHLSCIK
jgi:hypothetical protein